MNPLHPTLLAILLSGTLHAQEICNNALDDDGDGLIDLLDPDCACFGSLNSEVPNLIPNHSFEERTCCPYGFVALFTPPWLRCATGWLPGTTGTTDYFHTCAYMPPTLSVLPAPDGDGFVGGYVMKQSDGDAYFEYIRRNMQQSPFTPGSYVLEVWVAPTSTNGQHTATAGNYYAGQVTIALVGETVPHADSAATIGCLGQLPGYTELDIKTLAPTTAWQLVRFEFTTTTTLYGFSLGGSCDQPALWTTLGDVDPFILYDNFLLNTADHFVDGILRTGAWCTEDLTLTANLAQEATEGQWYRNGIALVGQTQATLDLSNADGGLYTFIQNGEEQCIRQDLAVPMRPGIVVLSADTGIAPLEVVFTTANGESGLWDFGDGMQLEGDTVVHVYEEPGSYSVGLQQQVLGCNTATSISDAVLVLEPEVLTITAGPQPTDINSTSITLTGHGPDGVETWSWDLGNVPPMTAEGQEITVEFPAVAGSYEVTLVVTGEWRESFSDTAHYTVVILQSVGVADDPAPNVLLLPNPVQDQLIAQAPFALSAWQVLNNLGQVVLAGRSNGTRAQIDVRALSGGTYVLRLLGADQPMHARFVKR